MFGPGKEGRLLLVKHMDDMLQSAMSPFLDQTNLTTEDLQTIRNVLTELENAYRVGWPDDGSMVLLPEDFVKLRQVLNMTLGGDLAGAELVRNQGWTLEEQILFDNKLNE